MRAAILTIILTVATVLTSLTAAPPASAAGPACTSVGIFGVRGSGEGPDSRYRNFGKEVVGSVDALESGLRAAGRTYTEFPLAYTAASTNILVPPASLILNPRNPNNIANYVNQVRQYLASVNDGVGALYTSLDLRSRACPTETPVLIGYSQGALVVRKVLQRLALNGQTPLLRRIGGAGLFADPSKQANEPNVGNAPPLSRGIATNFRLSGAPVAIPNAVLGRAINACNYRDVVCDFSVRGSTTVHTTYNTTGLPAALGNWLVNPTVRLSLPAPTTPPPGGGTTPPPVPTPPAVTPQVTLAQGPAAPAGFRYAVSLTGFAAGAAVSVTCHDSVSPAGFYTFSLTVNAAGAASTAAFCYSGDGPDHWVRAGGIESNHVTWGSTPPSPPALAPTWAETTGSVANTWTNYTNAGGAQGPTIGKNATIQIACKVTGFRVANGNTWWYRIASAPWSNSFYVSADAFYNNGATSGSLAGTPFVDPAVANC